VYRGWKEGLGWTNRARAFARCEVWLGDLQEFVWEDREWGRTANYIVPPLPVRTEGQQEGQQQQEQQEAGGGDAGEEADGAVAAGIGVGASNSVEEDGVGDGGEVGAAGTVLGILDGAMNLIVPGLDDSDDDMMTIEQEGNVMLTGDLDQFQWP